MVHTAHRCTNEGIDTQDSVIALFALSITPIFCTGNSNPASANPKSVTNIIHKYCAHICTNDAQNLTKMEENLHKKEQT